MPLPKDRDALLASAALGRAVAALLDPERLVEGVTAGHLRPELAQIAVVSHAHGGDLAPEQDLALTAGWGQGSVGALERWSVGTTTTANNGRGYYSRRRLAEGGNCG